MPIWPEGKSLPPNLSNSSVSTFRQCPAKFAYRYGLGLPDPGNIDSTIGHIVHEVLAKLYENHAPEDRTIDVARLIAGRVWKETAASVEGIKNGLEENRELVRAYKTKVWDCINGLFAMEDPTKVHMVATERKFYKTLGDGEGILGIVDRLDGGNGHGPQVIVDYKGLALDTPLPTPDGWAVMGDMQIGSAVYGRDGNPYTVTAVSAIHENICYEITLDNGTVIIADDEHSWVVWNRRTRLESVMTTAQISAWINHSMYAPTRNLYIPVGVNNQMPGTIIVPPGTWPENNNSLCIISVIQVPSEPTVCITVDSPDSTYIVTDRMIVTHNTGKRPKTPWQQDAKRQADIYGAVVSGSAISRSEDLLYPTEARFMYLAERSTLTFPINEETIKGAITEVQACRTAMKNAVAEQAFEPKVSALCSWCAYQAECPAFPTVVT